MKCNECSAENRDNTKFCANCGIEVGKTEKANDLRPCPTCGFENIPQAKFCANCGIEIRQQRPDRPQQQSSAQTRHKKKDLDIASKFFCSCGAWGEQPLDTCRCNTAIQERQFIRTNLQSGKSSQEIILAVNNTFGWMKSALSSRYDSLAHTTGQSTKLTVPKQPVSEMFA